MIMTMEPGRAMWDSSLANDQQWNNPGEWAFTWIGNQSTVMANDEESPVVPNVFALYQNYPNPFNPVTQITYSIPQQSYIVLEIFDLTGAHVKTLVDGKQNSGLKTVQWDGIDKNGILVGTGVYLYRINSNSFSQTRKMILIK